MEINVRKTVADDDIEMTNDKTTTTTTNLPPQLRFVQMDLSSSFD
jgi:hypothetical protein